MKKLYFIIALASLQLLFGSCFNDVDCIFQAPDQKQLYTITEFSYDPSTKQVQIIRTSKFETSNIAFDPSRAFNSTGYTNNAEATLLYNGYMNFGVKDVDNQPLEFESFNFNQDQFDYSTNNNQILFIYYGYKYLHPDFSDDSVLVHDDLLITYDISNSVFDTLHRSSSTFTDSVTVKTENIFSGYFGDNDRIIVLASNFDISLEKSSDGQISENSVYKDSHIVEFKTNQPIDTLYTYNPQTQFDHPSLIANNFGIYIEVGNSSELDEGVHQINATGELSFIANTEIPGQFSLDGSTYVSSFKNRIYSFESNKVYNLYDVFTNKKYVFPNSKNAVLIDLLNDSTMYYYSLETEEITDSITVADLPDFEPVPNEKISYTRLTNPILKEDNSVIFMAIKRSFLKDECD